MTAKIQFKNGRKETYKIEGFAYRPAIVEIYLISGIVYYFAIASVKSIVIA